VIGGLILLPPRPGIERNGRKAQEAARNHSLLLAKILGLIRKIKNSTWRFGEPE